MLEGGGTALAYWMLFKGVVFPLASELPSEARFLLEDFRLTSNEAIRIGLENKVTSRNAISGFAYNDLRERHPRIYAQHLVSALEVASAALKNYRRRNRGRATAKVPYLKRLMMKTENQAYKLDRERGVIDLPIRAGCHIDLKLVVS